MKPEMIAESQTLLLDASRRTFIKTASILCVGLSIMPTLAAESAQPQVEAAQTFEWLGGI
jgi:hypothetical protein